MDGKGPVSFGCGNGKELNSNPDLLFLLVAAEATCMMMCLCLVFLVFFFLFLSVKTHPEAHDSAKDLSIVTPLRYSQRIREKMCKLSDAVKDQDPCVSSLEQLGDLESKAVFIHIQSHALPETSAEIEE